MKVWVVFTGQYSNRRAVAAFASEAEARRVAGTIDRNDYDDDYEEFDVLDVAGERADVLRVSSYLHQYRDEAIPVVDKSEYVKVVWPFQKTPSAPLIESKRATIEELQEFASDKRPQGRTSSLVDVSGTDHALVRKVYGEQEAMALNDLALCNVEWTRYVEPTPPTHAMQHYDRS